MSANQLYFNAPDGDIVIESCDHKLFKCHINVLEDTCSYFHSLSNFNNILEKPNTDIIHMNHNTETIKFVMTVIYQKYKNLEMFIPTNTNVEICIDSLLLMDMLQITVDINDIIDNIIKYVVDMACDVWFDILKRYHDVAPLHKLINALLNRYHAYPVLCKPIQIEDIISLKNKDLANKLLPLYEMQIINSIGQFNKYMNDESFWLYVGLGYNNDFWLCTGLLHEMKDCNPHAPIEKVKKEFEMQLIKKSVQYLEVLCVRKYVIGENEIQNQNIIVMFKKICDNVYKKNERLYLLTILFYCGLHLGRGNLVHIASFLKSKTEIIILERIIGLYIRYFKSLDRGTEEFDDAFTNAEVILANMY